MEISAGEFKAKCLKLMDEVAETHEPIIITKRGKPVARLLPVENAAPRSRLFGYMAGTVTIHGDIVNVPHEAWAAENGAEDKLYAVAEPSVPYVRKSKTKKRA